MFPLVTGEYRNTRSIPSAPMCVITIGVFVSNKGAPQRNTVRSQQGFVTPLVQINVPRHPEKTSAPVRNTRQSQTREQIPSGSGPKQWNHPPATPSVAPSAPEPLPAAPPPYPRGPQSESLRSSIRRAAQQPSSNGSRSSKKVHFLTPDFEDSLGSPDSASSLLDPTPPVALPSGSEVMTKEEKPTARAPPSGDHDERETDGDFSSDMDDGEMVQQAVTKETQGDTDHLYRMDPGDIDSDSGSAIDGSGPALSFPIRRDVTSRPSFAQPSVSHHGDQSPAPSGHAVHQKVSEQAENATRRPETIPFVSSRQSATAQPRRVSSIQQSMHPGDWDDETVVGSTTDDSVPAMRVPLTPYTMGYERHISMHSAKVPFTTREASDSALQGSKSHDKDSPVDHATKKAPFTLSSDAALGSPQTRPSPIFVRRRRDRRTHDYGTDGTIEYSSDGSHNGQFQHQPQDLLPYISRQTTCAVHYDRRTGTISYEGLRDGYAYITRVRRP